MMSMADPIAIGVETLRIDSGCFGERVHWIDRYESLNGNIPNCQSGWFMSWLCMWSFDLRHQRHRVLIMTYESLVTGYLKRHILDTTWSPRRWLCDQDGIIHPRYMRRSTQGMRCG